MNPNFPLSTLAAAAAPPAAGRPLRRKLRKGTISCWGCKRRKVRCTFASALDTICVSCHRRGLPCISQEFPEEVWTGQPADGHGPVEPPSADTSTELDPTEPDTHIEAQSPPIRPTPLPTQASPAQQPQPAGVGSGARPENTGTLKDLAQALYAVFPSQEDANILYNIGQTTSVYFHQVNTKPRGMLENEGVMAHENAARLPSPDSHPVIIVRSMLSLAVFLMSLPSQQISGLSEQPPGMIKRLGNAALNFLSTNQNLLGNVEGLECIILEGVYESSQGNLRRAWFAFRRAMLLAQLMGIHRAGGQVLKAINPGTKISPQFVWFRIVYMDRFLCLLLGLPQGTTDTSMASEAALAADTPIGRLERLHTVIAARILERNESDRLRKDFSVTQAIDLELQRAEKDLPTKFWLPPTFYESERDGDCIFRETVRLVSQVYHYNLLNQLHLPYMICPNQKGNRAYSKITCANASREILTRFIMFRSFSHVASCCRPLDFFALLAAMTLLLAHLGKHASDATSNLLSHQRHGDRAMMEQVLENMDQVSRDSRDALSEKSANLLRRMLAIEEDAFGGGSYTAHRRPHAGEDDAAAPDVLRVSIPYFGTIKIVRDGGIAREPSDQVVSPNPQLNDGIGMGSVHAYYPNLAIGLSHVLPPSEELTEHDPFSPPLVDEQTQAQTRPAPRAGSPISGTTEVDMTPGGQAPVSDGASREDGGQQYLSLIANMDNWAFQGVDMAFFDNLTRGSGLFDRTDGALDSEMGW